MQTQRAFLFKFTMEKWKNKKNVLCSIGDWRWVKIVLCIIGDVVRKGVEA